MTRDDKIQKGGGRRTSRTGETGLSLCEELRKGSSEAIVARDNGANE